MKSHSIRNMCVSKSDVSSESAQSRKFLKASGVVIEFDAGNVEPEFLAAHSGELI